MGFVDVVFSPMVAFASAAFLVTFAACSASTTTRETPTTADAPDASAASEASRVPEAPPSPEDDPPSTAKIELGRSLFWDPILSGDRDVACATCHDPRRGWSDGLATSVGTGGAATARNALTILDTAWNGRTVARPRPDPKEAPMFWDNRVKSLEEQAKGPILAENEMRGASFTEEAIFPELVTRLEAIPGYVTRFEAAFGAGGIDETRIVQAIATFERTLVTTSSFDRGTLSAQALRGQAAFRASGCAGCHSGASFSDYALHRFERGGEAFRTPSLRNVTKTAPYMHDGRAETLEDVFDVYRRVDREADARLRAVRVPDAVGRADIAAFLRGLSDGEHESVVPDAVPSGLVPGGAPRR
ncbi:MAG: cytochrome C peroxidase [Deltaproteobacteria bacterium]|nr:cytochrome C peroxidase [Deltaproteobacteria bacterium]